MVEDGLSTNGKEILKNVVTIRALSPENPQDLKLARILDLASNEALNPDSQDHPEDQHAPMSETELVAWMRGSQTRMMRAIFQGEKCVGFVYLYNDSGIDADFRTRASKVREMMEKPVNHSVWELNFWIYENTADDVVAEGVEFALEELMTKKSRETTTVMFADAEDMRAAYQSATGLPGDLRKHIEPQAYTEFQDVRVLKDLLRFRLIGKMPYAKGELFDFVYGATLQKK